MSKGKTELYSQWLGGNLVIDDQRSTTGKRFYVHSGTGATTNSGFSPDAPLATIDAAVGKCTASKGDIIYVMPGHVETVAGVSALDFDVAGIKVIGLGWGDLRPKVQLSAQASTVEFNADDMWIENIIFEGTFAGGVTAGLDIKTGCDDLTLKNCVIRGTAAANELLIGVTIEATNDRITFDGCEFFEFVGGDASAAIHTEGAFSNLVIKNCTFQGDWSVACIDADAAAVTAQGVYCTDCLAHNSDAASGAFITLHDTTRCCLTRIFTHATMANGYPIDAGDDGATTLLECYGCEGPGGTSGILWPASATNFGA